MSKLFLLLTLTLLSCIAPVDTSAPSTEVIGNSNATYTGPIHRMGPTPCTMVQSLRGPNGTTITVPIPCTEWIDRGDPPDEFVDAKLVDSNPEPDDIERPVVLESKEQGM